MPEIILREEQARVLSEARAPVPVRDPNGATLGSLDPQDAIALAKHRKRLSEGAQGRRLYYSCESVAAQLDALEAERAHIGRFSAEYALEFVQKLEASNPEKYGPREFP